MTNCTRDWEEMRRRRADRYGGYRDTLEVCFIAPRHSRSLSPKRGARERILAESRGHRSTAIELPFMNRPASRLPWSTTSSAPPRLNRCAASPPRWPALRPWSLVGSRPLAVCRAASNGAGSPPAFALHGRTASLHTPPRLSRHSMLTCILPLVHRRLSSLVSLDADNIHAQSARERPQPAAAAGAAAAQRAHAGRRRRKGGGRIGRGPERLPGAIMGVCVRFGVGRYGLYGRRSAAASGRDVVRWTALMIACHYHAGARGNAARSPTNPRESSVYRGCGYTPRSSPHDLASLAADWP